MYDKRIKIFIAIIISLFCVCLIRLTQMQLLTHSYYRDKINQLKLRRGKSSQRRTIRGKILDRHNKILATDEPVFQLCVNYGLTSLLDNRVTRKYPNDKVKAKHADDLKLVIQKCARFKGVNPAEIKQRFNRINQDIWNRRTFQAWRKNFPSSDIIKNYDTIISVPLSAAVADFKQKQPDARERRRLINEVNISEMHRKWPILDLETDDDIFAAQLEFKDIAEINILAKAKRYYPYGQAAAQTIGWVGPPQETDKKLFADDKLSSYLSDDVCGRENGVEYVCEPMLHGRRGQASYDIDGQLVSETPTELGQNVKLTLDIVLQQKIENLLTDPLLNPEYWAKPSAAVVIDVNSAEILALVSLPTYNLNRARYDYGKLSSDTNRPLINRAIDKQYPPGSSVKPLILIAGLESGKITPDETINCPAQKAPRYWPNCWIWKQYKIGHGYENARNALRDSCNRFFSILADRIDPRTLQQWLFKFGYGRQILFIPSWTNSTETNRNFRQAPGQISSTRVPTRRIESFDQIPPLRPAERRYFGIGQGNLRVTPLHVANSMATIARNGLYIPPRIFLPDPNEPAAQQQEESETDLGIPRESLAVIRDGMYAVVNETRGTAHKAFADSGLPEQDVTVYGKTGSTQNPANAWFAGFATDSNNHTIAVAVVVEGGQHGSSDAAPLARDIIQISINEGYLGQRTFTLYSQ